MPALATFTVSQSALRAVIPGRLQPNRLAQSRDNCFFGCGCASSITTPPTCSKQVGPAQPAAGGRIPLGPAESRPPTQAGSGGSKVNTRPPPRRRVSALYRRWLRPRALPRACLPCTEASIWGQNQVDIEVDIWAGGGPPVASFALLLASGPPVDLFGTCCSVRLARC